MSLPTHDRDRCKFFVVAPQTHLPQQQMADSSDRIDDGGDELIDPEDGDEGEYCDLEEEEEGEEEEDKDAPVMTTPLPVKLMTSSSSAAAPAEQPM